MLLARGGRGGAALPPIPATQRTTEASGANGRRPAAGGRADTPARWRRFAAVLGAAVVVAVTGSACGQYPNVHRDTAVGQTPVSVTSPQPADPAAPGPASVRADRQVPGDGADGPGPHAVQGGTHASDLSKLVPPRGVVKKPGSKHAGSGPAKGSGSNSNGPGPSSPNAGGKGSSKSNIGGDDGANPGQPDIQGTNGQGSPPAGSVGLAELVSREAVPGAKYNSTILPAGFPFFICPVYGKYSYSDSYGAPRYAGGYHPHAGVDIFADEGTPIVAPFDGYVERVPNTLGGNAVKVHGAQGYVYMAHLVAYGITDRDVKKGTVVGFVGNTGDAQGTAYHDHFEWHPNHVAAYDRVISGTNGAVDPFPYLQVVCPPD